MGRRSEGSSGTLGARRGAVVLACVCLALTLGLVASYAGSAPSFARARSYATGSVPWSVAIGDLNGDGKTDLATANRNADSASVLLNRGDGSFQAKRDYATGSVPYSVAISDLNGDGNPDLATANEEAARANSVSVLLNRGDGSFPAKLDYATGRGPVSVAITDLNGDGKPDLATANGDAHSATVLLNRGDGSFQAKLDYAIGRKPFEFAIGDLNGDGKPDLATANGRANSVSVLLNRPGLCTVQDVTRQTVSAAKRMIARANCRVGKIRRAYSKTVMPGAGLEPARPRRGHLILSRPCRSRSVSVGLSFSCLPGLFVVLIVYGISARLGGSRCDLDATLARSWGAASFLDFFEQRA
jgi:hypothetical protein